MSSKPREYGICPYCDAKIDEYKWYVAKSRHACEMIGNEYMDYGDEVQCPNCKDWVPEDWIKWEF